MGKAVSLGGICLVIFVSGAVALAQEAAPVEPEATAVRPFNGKNLDGWKAKASRRTKEHLWKVGTAAVDPENPKLLTVAEGGCELVNTPAGHGKSLDLYSTYKHGDALKYHRRAWQYAGYNEYAYSALYFVAVSYQQVGRNDLALGWFEDYLEDNWEPQRRKEYVDYATKFVSSNRE